jgi:hypothetical protein
MKKSEITEAAAEDFFWNMIDKSNKKKRSHWSNYDIEEHLETLTHLLSGYDKQHLILFEKVLQEKLHKLYKAEIAELNMILENDFTKENGEIIFNHYLSDDAFIYFRCWLILKGKTFFEDICSDINAFISGSYSFNIADVWAEGLLFVTDEAYSVHHNNPTASEIKDAIAKDFPKVIHYDSSQRVMNRDPQSGATLQRMYPKLVEEMTALR